MPWEARPQFCHSAGERGTGQMGMERSLGDHLRIKLLLSQFLFLSHGICPFWLCVHLSRRHKLPCWRKTSLSARLYSGLEFLHEHSIPRRKERRLQKWKDWYRSLWEQRSDLSLGRWRQALIAGEKGGWRPGNETARREGKENTGCLPESEGREHSASTTAGFSDKYSQSPWVSRRAGDFG